MFDLKDILIEKCALRQGDRIAVGLSGGADSVCLLLLLCEAREELALELTAVHVHHGLRGAEADEDLRFAGELAGRLGVPFESVRTDVREKARREGVSVEEAGRSARYEALRRCAAGGLVAVGHHRDDQAETVLMNIVRGAGLAGAAGMDWRSGDIIRPLLGTGREEIEAFLRERGQEWRTDSTNLSDDYTRNRIRHEVLPLLGAINPGAAEHLAAFAADCRQACGVEEKCAEEILKQSLISPDEVSIPVDALTGAGAGSAGRAVIEAMASLAGSRRDIGRVHVRQVLDLTAGASGRGVDLPYGLRAGREYDRILIRRAETFSDRIREEDRALCVRLNALLAPPVIRRGMNASDVPKKEYTKWFDYDKIKDTLVWRSRRPGDTIALAGAGDKSIARFMLDAKIPAARRGSMPLLADGSSIVWVPGYRISEAYKVTDSTESIIEINIEGVYDK